MTCDRCNNDADHLTTHDDQWVCDKCLEYLMSDEYQYDLKDKEGESRYEQHREK
jgi:hypothetical protein